MFKVSIINAVKECQKPLISILNLLWMKTKYFNSINPVSFIHLCTSSFLAIFRGGSPSSSTPETDSSTCRVGCNSLPQSFIGTMEASPQGVWLQKKSSDKPSFKLHFLEMGSRTKKSSSTCFPVYTCWRRGFFFSCRSDFKNSYRCTVAASLKFAVFLLDILCENFLANNILKTRPDLGNWFLNDWVILRFFTILIINFQINLG